MAQAPSKSMGDPAGEARAVTKSDSADLPFGVCSALFVGTAGDVVAYVGPTSTTAVTFKVGTAPFIIPAQVRRVLSTSTTAGDMIALY